MFHFAIIENSTIIINHKLPLLYRNQDKLRIKTPKLGLDNYQDLSSWPPKQIKTKIMNNFYLHNMFRALKSLLTKEKFSLA